MINEYRKEIKQILKKEKNQRVKNAEQIIFDAIVKIAPEYNIDVESDEFIELYKEHSYDLIGIILNRPSNLKLKDILNDIKQGNLGRDSLVFKPYKIKKKMKSSEKSARQQYLTAFINAANARIKR